MKPSQTVHQCSLNDLIRVESHGRAHTFHADVALVLVETMNYIALREVHLFIRQQELRINGYRFLRWFCGTVEHGQMSEPSDNPLMAVFSFWEKYVRKD
jgi:hypothetical protein